MIMVKIIEFDFLKGAGNGSYFAKAVHLSSQILTVTGRSIVLHKFANSVNSCPVHITDNLKQIAFFKYVFWQILLPPFQIPVFHSSRLLSLHSWFHKLRQMSSLGPFEPVQHATVENDSSTSSMLVGPYHHTSLQVQFTSFYLFKFNLI